MGVSWPFQKSFGIQITSAKPIIGKGVPLNDQSGLASQCPSLYESAAT